MLRFLITIFITLSSVSSQAQDSAIANGETFGVWEVVCSATGVGQTSCVLSQQIHRSEDNAFIAQVMAFQNADASKTYLSARVPLGAYLPAGFLMRSEDSEEALALIWQTCLSKFCEAITEISPEKLAELAREDSTVLGGFRPSVQGSDFIFRFAMTGAIEGLAALQAAKGQ